MVANRPLAVFQAEATRDLEERGNHEDYDVDKSLLEQGVDEVSSPCRSGELKKDGTAIGLHRNTESQEPTAVTFGLHNAGDQGERVSEKAQTRDVVRP